MKRTSSKRYFTEEQIIGEIELAKTKFASKMTSAIFCDQKADRILRDSQSEELAISKRQEAKRRRKEAYRIENQRLPFLKQKLAEFQTPMLPAIDDGDASISASARKHSRKPEPPTI